VTNPIFVWAVVTDERGVLLVPARETDGWLLPGGPLLDDDETVEAAVARELLSRYGVSLPAEPDFLATRYERRPDGRTAVHNLFLVPADHIDTGLTAFGEEVRWMNPEAAELSGVPAWLTDGLTALFDDEADLPSFDLSAVEAAMAEVRSVAPIVILTGPAGAGKSSVARELCRRFERAAHIEVDLLRDMVVSGYASPIPSVSDPDQSEEQIGLSIANAAAIASNFSASGIVAVIDDVLETSDLLDRYLDAIGPGADVRMVTLMADRAVLARRDAGRPHDQQMGARSEALHQIFMTNGETRGVRLDTSHWGIEETADTILERWEEARVEEVVE
jgi:chloramphenicol 3-O-phosphotransferase/ADP-ribose pyrophosphatase YjhB (NUDIX family)